MIDYHDYLKIWTSRCPILKYSICNKLWTLLKKQKNKTKQNLGYSWHCTTNFVSLWTLFLLLLTIKTAWEMVLMVCGIECHKHSRCWPVNMCKKLKETCDWYTDFSFVIYSYHAHLTQYNISPWFTNLTSIQNTPSSIWSSVCMLWRENCCFKNKHSKIVI